MRLSPNDLVWLQDVLIYSMQASVLVPAAVVWVRRRSFPAPIRRLSWYVYLSMICSLGGDFYATVGLPNNYWFIISFQLGKMALFGGVYYLALKSPKVRVLTLVFTAAALVGVLAAVYYDLILGIAVARVTHCALLAGFALLYMEQFANRTKAAAATQDPLWLLSLGQLLYSAGTVTAASFDSLTVTKFQQPAKYFFIAGAGLVFNWFLTLVFLRAKPAELPAAEPARRRSSQSNNPLAKFPINTPN